MTVQPRFRCPSLCLSDLLSCSLDLGIWRSRIVLIVCRPPAMCGTAIVRSGPLEPEAARSGRMAAAQFRSHDGQGLASVAISSAVRRERSSDRPVHAVVLVQDQPPSKGQLIEIVERIRQRAIPLNAPSTGWAELGAE